MSNFEDDQNPFSERKTRSSRDDDSGWNDRDEKPKKSGWGCVIWTLIILFSIFCLCCCGTGIFFYSLKPKVMNDPAQIDDMKNILVDSPVPERFKPTFAGTWNIIFMGSMSGAVYANEKDDEYLAFVRVKVAKPEMKPVLEKIKNQTFNEQVGKNAGEKSTIISTKTQIIDMDDGKKIEFLFREFQNTETGIKTYTLTGTLPTTDSENIIFYSIPSEKWNEEDAVDLVKKFKLKETP